MAKPGKAQAKSAGRADNAVQSAITGAYNTLIPLKDACGVYVKHPMSSRTLRVSTYTEEFIAIYRELRDLGMGERLERELAEFTELYGPEWGRVRDWVNAQLADGNETDASE